MSHANLFLPMAKDLIFTTSRKTAKFVRFRALEKNRLYNRCALNLMEQLVFHSQKTHYTSYSIKGAIYSREYGIVHKKCFAFHNFLGERIESAYLNIPLHSSHSEYSHCFVRTSTTHSTCTHSTCTYVH